VKPETPLDLVEQFSREAPDGRVILTPASAIRPEKVDWALAQRVPLGGVTILAGMQGLGKSTLSLEWAARWSRGQAAGDLYGQPTNIIIATAEDSAAGTIVPRLIAAGADRSRISLVQIVRDGLALSPTLPDDVEALAQRMREIGARVLIVDPLSAHLARDVNSWRDQDIRRALAPLHRLAERVRAAIVCVAHLNKGASPDGLERISGSVAISAAARSAFLVGEDPADRDGPTRLLVHLKSNLAPLAPAWRFRVEGRTVDTEAGIAPTSGIAWCGEVNGVHASDLLTREDPSERSARERAIEWLRDALAEGAMLANDVKREAQENGISAGTLRRAREALGVVLKKARRDLRRRPAVVVGTPGRCPPIA